MTSKRVDAAWRRQIIAIGDTGLIQLKGKHILIEVKLLHYIKHTKILPHLRWGSYNKINFQIPITRKIQWAWDNLNRIP